jgi:hypothetical protein
MKIGILDASTGFLHILNCPEHLKQSEEIEEFLEDQGFDLNNIDWMELKKIITDLDIN